MVTTCFICKWQADKYPRRSFHKFPSDDLERQKWSDIIQKNDLNIGKRAMICSIHFEENCFKYGSVCGVRLLKKGSLPSLNLTYEIKSSPSLVLPPTEKKITTNSNISQSLGRPGDDVSFCSTSLQYFLGNDRCLPNTPEFISMKRFDEAINNDENYKKICTQNSSLKTDESKYDESTLNSHLNIKSSTSSSQLPIPIIDKYSSNTLSELVIERRCREVVKIENEGKTFSQNSILQCKKLTIDSKDLELQRLKNKLEDKNRKLREKNKRLKQSSRRISYLLRRLQSSKSDLRTCKKQVAEYKTDIKLINVSIAIASKISEIVE